MDAEEDRKELKDLTQQLYIYHFGGIMMKHTQRFLSILILSAMILTMIPACSESQNADSPEEETTSAVIEDPVG